MPRACAKPGRRGSSRTTRQRNCPRCGRVSSFNALFTDAVEGDEFTLDFTPGAGTRVTRNGKLLGTIEGDDFNRALLAIWLGERPADRRLKKAMLGA